VACWGEDLNDSCAHADGLAGVLPRPIASENVECITDVQVNTGFVVGRGADGALRLWGGAVADALPRVDSLITRRSIGFLDPIRIGSGYTFVVVESAAGEYFLLGSVILVHGVDQEPPAFKSLEFEAPELKKLGLSGPSRSLSRGGQHFCAAMADGALYCFGNNRSGQLALQGVLSVEEPTLVPTPEPVLMVDTDYEATCVLVESGAVYCAGSNFGGHLARPGEEVRQSDAFLLIEGLPPVSELWIQGGSACARAADGLWCWAVPGGGIAPEPAGEPVVPIDVSMTSETLCVLDGTGTVYCRDFSLSTEYMGNCYSLNADWQAVNFNLICD
jgi:hypothetical protein